MVATVVPEIRLFQSPARCGVIKTPRIFQTKIMLRGKKKGKRWSYIAEPQPKVLNRTSLITCVSGSTLIWSRITSPHCMGSGISDVIYREKGIGKYIRPARLQGPPLPMSLSCQGSQHCVGASNLYYQANLVRCGPRKQFAQTGF